MKVLIIEDHPMVVQGWVMQIKHHAPDCQIHHVNDWPSAHTIVMRSHRLQVPFDWVIMDVALSRSQSQDALLPPLAQRIRACAPSLVWVCTALNDDSIRQTCAQQGARWVAKTMHSVTWQRMVREQLLALQDAGHMAPCHVAEPSPNPLMRLTPVKSKSSCNSHGV